MTVVSGRQTYTFHVVHMQQRGDRGSDAIVIDRNRPGNEQFVFPTCSVRTFDRLKELMDGATEHHVLAVWELLQGLSQ